MVTKINEHIIHVLKDKTKINAHNSCIERQNKNKCTYFMHSIQKQNKTKIIWYSYFLFKLTKFLLSELLK